MLLQKFLLTRLKLRKLNLLFSQFQRAIAEDEKAQFFGDCLTPTCDLLFYINSIMKKYIHENDLLIKEFYGGKCEIEKLILMP